MFLRLGRLLSNFEHPFTPSIASWLPPRHRLVTHTCPNISMAVSTMGVDENDNPELELSTVNRGNGQDDNVL
eukprot:m.39375 g.39375  ORF g.39375 m.39375 type:complete len:72 (+) comp12671_c0_seq6:282-497(+)